MDDTIQRQLDAADAASALMYHLGKALRAASALYNVGGVDPEVQALLSSVEGDLVTARIELAELLTPSVMPMTEAEFLMTAALYGAQLDEFEGEQEDDDEGDRPMFSVIK